MRKLWHSFCCYIGYHVHEKVSYRRDVKTNGTVVASVIFENILKCKHCGLCNANGMITKIETGVKGGC